MPRLLERARRLAAELRRTGIAVAAPTEPQTNLFHVFVRGTPESLERAHLDFAQRERFWLTGRFNATRMPGWSSFELYVGDNALRLSDDEICAALRRVVDTAEAAQESQR
jgi:hypothetical protein